MTEKKSIAIIGSGISGLSAAWLLHKKYKVTLFEKNDYIGGHTHTHDINEDVDDIENNENKEFTDKKPLAIDSGFIVFNEKNYPNLVGLFNQLDVKTQDTEMSFAFSLDQGQLEYAGTGLAGMFAQFTNLMSVKHWRLLKEIVRFNKTAHAELPRLAKQKSTEYSLASFLKQHEFSVDLQQNYLLPMGAAIWSCPVEIMYNFPAFSFLQFFSNHGLIDLKNRPQWRSVIGGSREYINKMMPLMKSDISVMGGAELVLRDNDNNTLNKNQVNGITVISDGNSFQFDQVIFACHADEALKLLDNASTSEQDVLSCFKYQENITYLHTDESLMPKRKRAWCSWNYLAQSVSSDGPESGVRKIADTQVTATYWMNKLQKINPKKNYLVTLNPYQEIDKSKVIKTMNYHHPVFDRDAINAQTRLGELQGKNNSWFCGSYAGYGFHEDGIASSVAVCEQLGVIAPWNDINNSITNSENSQ